MKPHEMRTATIMGDTFTIRSMDPRWRGMWQRVCTSLGFATYCPFSACKRARRCATKEVICRQLFHNELNVLLHRTFTAKLEGRPIPPWPDGKEAWDAYFADGWPEPEATARTNHEPHDQWRTIGPSAELDEERLRAITRARRVPAETDGGENPT